MTEITLSEEQLLGVINALENPSPLSTSITVKFLESLLEKADAMDAS